jgi:hypothetical protein
MKFLIYFYLLTLISGKKAKKKVKPTISSPKRPNEISPEQFCHTC